jgi:hypothetical protein
MWAVSVSDIARSIKETQHPDPHRKVPTSVITVVAIASSSCTLRISRPHHS